MALVRLAKLNDYSSIQVLGRTMFKITWCDSLCPGSPTDDPEEGLQLFNMWQCEVAAGLSNLPSPEDKIKTIVDWCLNMGSSDCKKIASEIIKANRTSDYSVSLEFDSDLYAEPGLEYRYALAFLNPQIQLLAAAQVMQLQNIMQVAEYD